MHRKLVIIESPYAGKSSQEHERNAAYARAATRDCLLRGEQPFASHIIYTQPGVLNDEIREERELGIRSGWCWRAVADLTAVYTDLGISRGMQEGIDHAKETGHPIEQRSLTGWSNGRI